MGKAQFAQKVDTVLHEKLSQLIDQYSEDGRIKEKGEILSILYQDHMASEKKRQINELMFAAEIQSLLGRIEEVFLQSSKSLQLQIELMAKRHEDEKHVLNSHIIDLERVIEVQKQQLHEKTINIYETQKQLEKCQKQQKRTLS